MPERLYFGHGDMILLLQIWPHYGSYSQARTVPAIQCELEQDSSGNAT